MANQIGPSELLRYQPNRFPFLMIDVVVDHEPGKFAVAKKNFTWNEWFFPKHFLGHPNVPGALQLEAMAQTLTVALTTLDGLEGTVTHALEHKVRFRREILPGETLLIRADVHSWKRGIAKGAAEGHVNNELACSAEMIITIPEILKEYRPKVAKEL